MGVYESVNRGEEPLEKIPQILKNIMEQYDSELEDVLQLLETYISSADFDIVTHVPVQLFSVFFPDQTLSLQQRQSNGEKKKKRKKNKQKKDQKCPLGDMMITKNLLLNCNTDLEPCCLPGKVKKKIKRKNRKKTENKEVKQENHTIMVESETENSVVETSSSSSISEEIEQNDENDDWDNAEFELEPLPDCDEFGASLCTSNLARVTNQLDKIAQSHRVKEEEEQLTDEEKLFREQRKNAVSHANKVWEAIPNPVNDKENRGRVRFFKEKPTTWFYDPYAMRFLQIVGGRKETDDETDDDDDENVSFVHP